MSKVITLSRYFQKGHPRAGEPTYFVEKVLRGLHVLSPEAKAIMDMGVWSECTPKHHTIRAGKRWKTGDKASLRVWSGKPYNSKQIVIAPDVELVVKDVEIDIDGNLKIDGVLYCALYWNEKIPELSQIAKNDGLSVTDFLAWFSKLPFSGQLLIWNNNNLPY